MANKGPKLPNRTFFTEPKAKAFRDVGLQKQKKVAHKNNAPRSTLSKGMALKKEPKDLNKISYPARRWNAKKLP